MNKKVIRLTESDLHNIVKESVNKILKEAVNELDPRTYASYADKRRAQGQDDKAWQGTVAARDAYNKQYGTNDSHYGEDGSYHSTGHYMRGNDYTVTDAEQNVYSDGKGTRARGYQQEYNPYNDTYDYEDWNKSIYDDQSKPVKRNSLSDSPYVSAIKDPRHKIAQQMAKGNGEYIKGKGWK